jgi:hypothetical protein
MLTVDDFATIRQARRDGLTIRQLAEQFGHSTKTILKALAEPEPKPYTLAQPRVAPVFGPFRQVVDAILRDDLTAPPKQRHTASQLVTGRVCPEVADYRFTNVTRLQRDFQEGRFAAAFPPMKTYTGYRLPGEEGTAAPGVVTVHQEGRQPRPLDPRLDLRRHADGLNWGYGGSGPAQLALALGDKGMDEAIDTLVKEAEAGGTKPK